MGGRNSIVGLSKEEYAIIVLLNNKGYYPCNASIRRQDVLCGVNLKWSLIRRPRTQRIVPVASRSTSWLRFSKRLRLRLVRKSLTSWLPRIPRGVKRSPSATRRKVKGKRIEEASRSTIVGFLEKETLEDEANVRSVSRRES